ncbi:MAG: DUF370 domain-containing protein [Eubacteriales bacterium]|nr:DUF370 domain-containing protein [Clostridiales bacterium]MDY3941599.1 DUF370 domain-containing protein [Eubacteriales bacterium]
MLLHIGEGTLVRAENVVGFFDIDGDVTPEDTRAFLRQAEAEGVVELLTTDVPRAIVVTMEPPAGRRVYVTRVSAATLAARLMRDSAPRP